MCICTVNLLFRTHSYEIEQCRFVFCSKMEKGYDKEYMGDAYILVKRITERYCMPEKQILSKLLEIRKLCDDLDRTGYWDCTFGRPYNTLLRCNMGTPTRWVKRAIM